MIADVVETTFVIDAKSKIFPLETGFSLYKYDDQRIHAKKSAHSSQQALRLQKKLNPGWLDSYTFDL